MSVGLCAFACGRPATEKDCREILRRSAELELSQQLGNNDTIEAEVQAIEESMKDSMMKKCVGKRITDGAMKCIRGAKTSKELFDKCF